MSDTEIDTKLRRIQEKVASANSETAQAVKELSSVITSTHPVSDLDRTHSELRDAYRELVEALNQVESFIDDSDSDHYGPTPRQIQDEHSTRLKEQYEGPVLYLAQMLLDRNRHKWLYQQYKANGADEVERHGLTQNQRLWLNELQDFWDASESDYGSVDDESETVEPTDESTPISVEHVSDADSFLFSISRPNFESVTALSRRDAELFHTRLSNALGQFCIVDDVQDDEVENTDIGLSDWAPRSVEDEEDDFPGRSIAVGIEEGAVPDEYWISFSRGEANSSMKISKEEGVVFHRRLSKGLGKFCILDNAPDHSHESKTEDNPDDD